MRRAGAENRRPVGKLENSGRVSPNANCVRYSNLIQVRAVSVVRRLLGAQGIDGLNETGAVSGDRGCCESKQKNRNCGQHDHDRIKRIDFK